ncbi:MAG TPA: GNAT family N-acetyltransferase [Polyangiaceae bacterium]
MAAVTSRPRVEVRAPKQGEGTRVAALWRELWIAHEDWGGYASSHDDRVFERLARRLDDDARVRADYPVLGRHIHLVATVGGEIAGQVEGWFDRHGYDPSTPFTCEVRSLVVAAGMRKLGVGQALLDTLAQLAKDLARGEKSLLVAEVLEPNPAHSFYARLGFAHIAWCTHVSSHVSYAPQGLSARVARPADALAIALLEGPLAQRRRAAGDARFDPPHAIDATLVGAIAAHLGRPADPLDPVEIVAVDREGVVRATSTFGISSLDPPFAPTRRAVLARLTIDPAMPPAHAVAPMVSLAASFARAGGAPGMELVDLTAPRSPLYEATLAIGARPWSRIIQRPVE